MRSSRARSWPLLVFVLLAGCKSTVSLRLEENQQDLSVPSLDASADMLDLSVALGDLSESVDLACTPTVTSCVGLCGPIFDTCLGKNVQCGTCDDGGVCDLVTHTCGVPKVDCTALGAECGVVKNSCGTRLTCPSPTPYCDTGKECDPETNKCVDCDPAIACAYDGTCDPGPACASQGYQCGSAWLGCGDVTKTVQCGTCSTGQTCNPFYNVCEPQCTPASNAQLCTDALNSRGVECGFISDGCGGRVRCPPSPSPECQPGYACAAQGEQNKCQPVELPVECITAGRNCGDLTSVCGGTVHCGDCTAPDVCNSNGVCGAPCTPKTCTELGNPACGTVDDGCMGLKKCNDCPPGGYLCLTDHTCCKPKTSADFPAGTCGTAIPDGCGNTINLGCTAPAVCTSTTPGVTGTCCTDTACGNSCNTTATNSCTGMTENCTCSDPTNYYCNGTPGTCTKRKTCTDLGATGTDGKMCSNGNAFDDGSGTLIQCPCQAGANHYCITGTAPNGTVVPAGSSTIGICCTDTNSCGTQCNTTVPNSCTGNANNHTCGTGVCGSKAGCNTNTDMCVTCATLGATGGNGSTCSNGNAFDVGNGTLITCPCNSGLICSNGSGMKVTGSTKGMCCQNTAACPSGSGSECNVASVTNTCDGSTIKCGITCNPSTQVCSASSNGTCVAINNCANIGARMGLANPSQQRGGAFGNPCNDFTNYYTPTTGFPAFACPCNDPSKPNTTCTGDSSSAEGQCTCAADTSCNVSGTFNCKQDGVSDGCGGTKSCKCTAGDTCLASGACCTPHDACGSPPSGIPAPDPTTGSGSCNYDDGCGTSIGTQCCPTMNTTFNLAIESGAITCVHHAGSSPSYGDCVCTPTHKCTDPGESDGMDDGCGHPLHCAN